MKASLRALILSVLLGVSAKAQSHIFPTQTNATATNIPRSYAESQLAFNYVAKKIMLAEANFVGRKLSLSISFPLRDANLLSTIAVVPRDRFGFGGFLKTDKYQFDFSTDERLHSIRNLQLWEELHPVQKRPTFVKQKSLIDTNDAYQIATNWLEQMSVSVRELERDDPYMTKFYGSNATSTLPLVSVKAIAEDTFPLFEVLWQSIDGPRVTIVIDGRTKDLIELELHDNSVCHRPAPLIKNLDQLLRISDEEFQAYSEEQRKNLKKRFAAVTYDSTNN
jgi:hypothetical protein